MNEEMELKLIYKETFDEISVPEALAGKVKNMLKLKESRELADKKYAREGKNTVLKKLAVAAAAAFVVLFVGSNGIVYATTGSTWVKTVMVSLNGTEYSMNLKGEVGDDNLVTYSGYIGEEDNPTAVMIVNELEAGGAEEAVNTYIIMSSPEIVEKDGKIYLKDNQVEIDITEDAKDGIASGTYQVDNITYQYQVEYEGEAWSISVLKYGK